MYLFHINFMDRSERVRNLMLIYRTILEETGVDGLIKVNIIDQIGPELCGQLWEREGVYGWIQGSVIYQTIAAEQNSS
jgi:hypothetical protein